MSRKRLPAVQDCGQTVVMVRREDDVNVIRHDAPSAQQVSIFLEVEKGSFDNRGHGRLFQETAASIRERIMFWREPHCFAIHSFKPVDAPLTGDIKEAKRHKIGAPDFENMWEISSPPWNGTRQGSGIHDPFREDRLLRSSSGHDEVSISSPNQCAGGTPAPQSCLSIYSLWCGRPARKKPRTIVVRASRPHRHQRRSMEATPRRLLRTCSVILS